MQVIQSIENRIYEVRGERVMLDKDLAALYEVPTKSLNLSVKRNIGRFPPDFMFQLSREEFDLLKLQTRNMENEDEILRFQFETSKRGGTRYLAPAVLEKVCLKACHSAICVKKCLKNLTGKPHTLIFAVPN